jgi:hypothetical protein
VQYKNMDEKRIKIKEFVESSDVPEGLKAEELKIVEDQSLSTPEVEIELTKLIAKEFDESVASMGVTDVPKDSSVESSLNNFEQAANQAQSDLSADMEIVESNLKAVGEVSEEIQKAAIRASLEEAK